MPHLYRAKHRRPIITDRPFHGARPAADVQNEARCTRPDTHGTFCIGLCPRHRPVDYSECMARHATDSI